MKISGALILACTFAATASAPAQKPEFVTPKGAQSSLPLSEAVRVGNTLYLSGMIGVKPGSMTLVEGGIAAETLQTLQNIQAAVERAGGNMDNVVKCLVMLADMGEWARMNEVYVTFFPTHKPARSAFGTNGLALGARVEIECIAVIERK